MNKHLISSCSIIYLNARSNKMTLLFVIDIHDTACTTFPQTVNDIVEVLDDIQVWPEGVVEDMGPE